ncbi:hypothetical protein E2C01_037669 [Portunus trituberculatus]|uniref:Uncharacterized protein n=1 Tax=Portunus trituberculatus TaxID=210409 RepID=A0A5B7F8Q6_PORTR|nr:hypothetical protein [Portunus trituberculatus]
MTPSTQAQGMWYMIKCLTCVLNGWWSAGLEAVQVNTVLWCSRDARKLRMDFALRRCSSSISSVVYSMPSVISRPDPSSHWICGRPGTYQTSPLACTSKSPLFASHTLGTSLFLLLSSNVMPPNTTNTTNTTNTNNTKNTINNTTS